MAYLEKFSSAEKNLIIRLPYRCGLWVSVVDDTGGGQASEKEVQALNSIITAKTQGMFQSAFVHEVFEEVFRSRDNWQHWSENLKSVPEDCERVAEILKTHLAPRDQKAYRAAVMGIAIRVARAFREFDVETPLFKRLWTWVGITIDKLFGAVKNERYVSEQLLSISYEEDLALSRLSAALSFPEETDLPESETQTSL